MAQVHKVEKIMFTVFVYDENDEFSYEKSFDQLSEAFEFQLEIQAKGFASYMQTI